MLTLLKENNFSSFKWKFHLHVVSAKSQNFIIFHYVYNLKVFIFQ